MAKNDAKWHKEDAQQESQNQGGDEEITTEKDPEQLTQLQAERDEYLDKYRRSAAEFDNYRKRQARDQARLTSQITADVVRDLLPIVDDLQRAIKHLPDGGAEANWAQGVLLIEQKLQKLLKSYGVVAIEAEGAQFDPTIHESLLTETSDSHPEGTVIEVLEVGYRLDDMVVRPAKVKVSTGSAASD